MGHSRWQTSDLRNLRETSEKAPSLWSTIWEVGPVFQTCSIISLEGFWKEAQDSGLFQEVSFLLISFTYPALQWQSYSLKKVFLDQKQKQKQRKVLEIVVDAQDWISMSAIFPLALLFLRLPHGIFGVKPHIQTWVWNPKAKNGWYFFPQACQNHEQMKWVPLGGRSWRELNIRQGRWRQLCDLCESACSSSAGCSTAPGHPGRAISDHWAHWSGCP